MAVAGIQNIWLSLGKTFAGNGIVYIFIGCQYQYGFVFQRHSLRFLLVFYDNSSKVAGIVGSNPHGKSSSFYWVDARFNGQECFYLFLMVYVERFCFHS